jgi:hypothetical protein
VAEKEYAMQSLISSHEKLTTLKKEIAKLEAGKRDLSSLDEATSIREERFSMCRGDAVAECQNKCEQTEEWAPFCKEAKFREELLSLKRREKLGIS